MEKSGDCSNRSTAARGWSVAIALRCSSTKVDLHLENLWDRNIIITTRLVDTVSTPMLLSTVGSNRLDPNLLITHHFELSGILDAYETFAHAAETRALKVIIEA